MRFRGFEIASFKHLVFAIGLQKSYKDLRKELPDLTRTDFDFIAQVICQELIDRGVDEEISPSGLTRLIRDRAISAGF